MQTAQARWLLLQKFVKSKQHSTPQENSLGLINQTQDENACLFEYQHVRITCAKPQQVSLAHFAIAQQTTVDNTGIAKLWPAEEALAWYCLQQQNSEWQDKTVLELGAGMGIAGLMLAKSNTCKHVCISDGNALAVQRLQIAIQENQIQASAQLLAWHQPATFANTRANIILGADWFVKKIIVDKIASFSRNITWICCKCCSIAYWKMAWSCLSHQTEVIRWNYSLHVRSNNNGK